MLKMLNLPRTGRLSDRVDALFSVSLFSLVCLSLFLSLFLIGCGDGRPSRVKVSGFVTVDGEPLKFGSVNIRPAAGGRSASGSLDSNGAFIVTMYEKGDGLPPGSYRVAIKATQWVSDGVQRWHAPKKYADHENSGLTVEISEPTSDLTFDLTWDGEKRSKPWVEKQ